MRKSSSDPLGSYLLGWAVLLLLLGVSVGSAYLKIGPLHPWVNFGVAFTQAAIAFLLFMQLRGRPSLRWVFACAGFLWLLIFFSLTAFDYFTRQGFPLPSR